MRTAVFIDGDNIFHGVRNFDPDCKINWDKFRKHLEKYNEIVSISIYFGERSNGNGNGNGNSHEKANGWKNFLKYLEVIGYRVVLKPLSYVYDSGSGDQVGHKSNIDIELAVDMSLMATTGRIDQVILVSGDRDFLYPLKTLSRPPYLIRNIVISFKGQTAQDLISTADKFFYLDDFMRQIQESR